MVRKGKRSLPVGLLGHWAAWTSNAVQLLKDIKAGSSLEKLLAKGVSITEMNAAIFDVENNFRGCIPGIHEVLRRQGLLEGIWCLDPKEELSAGQSQKINRIIKDYPHLMDDDFVRTFLNNDS